ncbi:hypothetical protein EXE46_15115 [Halorubrum sp. GN11_10-6_MGM]|uniref:hypothetical protein n=1 Tax=Halorubrum sp. GN11_10-6_MGM TaxID=2518112 RepID=UPI0010F715A8|nr:hypothetical protein [Halorubrum sp. GN11_10-6_MGM]TKX72912.1 hypothetical protein EXE46_15115 [Halorubrum sp. GN11_10-6_MGM]
MRRRKLLIGIGAAAAGGSAAFGTEAFTSVQAERNVDVSVAGDSSSFVAIQPLSSDNAGKYVDTENGDSTVEINLDGDNSGSGEGVAQDAVTQLEDLFRVVNQGSQPVSVYFEDDSDAVTFRVSGSADALDATGQSLEGADNSADLAVGEQVVVGMTVDTLSNDVSGQLLDSVVLYADANASSPGQNVPQPQYVVDSDAFGDPDDDGDSEEDSNDENIFPSISEAVSAAESRAVVGVRNAEDINEGVTIDKPLTLSGFEGKPSVNVSELVSDEAINIESDDVTIRNLSFTYDGLGRDDDVHLISGAQPSDLRGLTIQGLDITSNASFDTNAIDVRGVDIEITDNTVTDAGIQVQHGSGSSSGGSVTISGNSVTESDSDGGILGEGITAFTLGEARIGDFSYTIEDNLVSDTGTGTAAIKLTDIGSEQTPADVNGETGKFDQIEALLRDNDAFPALIQLDTTLTDSSSSDGSFFTAQVSAGQTTVVSVNLDNSVYSPGEGGWPANPDSYQLEVNIDSDTGDDGEIGENGTVGDAGNDDFRFGYAGPEGDPSDVNGESPGGYLSRNTGTGGTADRVAVSGADISGYAAIESNDQRSYMFLIDWAAVAADADVPDLPSAPSEIVINEVFGTDGGGVFQNEAVSPTESSDILEI